jgi:two-component system cell cycle response regulator
MAKLLLVDDNLEATRPLAMLFRFFKHTVDLATSGNEALALLEHSIPDVLVLDIMMPGMDGMELLQRIRAEARTANLPVVMYSAVSDPSYRQAAMEKGADDYLVKGSVEIDELRARIEQAAAAGHAGNSSGQSDSNAPTDQPPGQYH